MNNKGRTTYMVDGKVHVCGITSIFNNRPYKFMAEAVINKYSHLTTKTNAQEGIIKGQRDTLDPTRFWYHDEVTRSSTMAKNDTEARDRVLNMREKFSL